MVGVRIRERCLLQLATELGSGNRPLVLDIALSHVTGAVTYIYSIVFFKLPTTALHCLVLDQFGLTLAKVHSGRDHLERIRATTLQSRQHSLPHRTQVLRKSASIRVQKVIVELVSRICDSVDQFERNFEVAGLCISLEIQRE